MAQLLRIGTRFVELGTGRTSDGTLLRPLELALLRYLADRQGEVVPLDRLLVDVWGYHVNVRSRAPYSAMMRLRKAIEPDPGAPRHLLSHRGSGYSLVDAAFVTHTALRQQLPADDAPFVGRAALIAGLPGATARLVTLVGPPGVGKTRLARELAPPGEAWLCDLHAATTLEDAEAAVAGTLPAGSG
ncbi:MAG: winged helix-turn-helix domain-containing protein, partial [Myxococcota bacterium]